MFSFSKNGGSSSDSQGTASITSFQSFLQHLPKSTTVGNRTEDPGPARPKLQLAPSSQASQPSHLLTQGGFSFGSRSEWLPPGSLHPPEKPNGTKEDNSNQITFTALLGSTLLQSNTSSSTRPVSPITPSPSNISGHDRPVSEQCELPPIPTPGPRRDVSNSTLIERAPTPPVTPQKHIEGSTEQVPLTPKEDNQACTPEPCTNKLSGEKPGDARPDKPSGGLSRASSRTLLVAKTALVEKIRQLNGLSVAFGGHNSARINTNMAKPQENPAESTAVHHPSRKHYNQPPTPESHSLLTTQESSFVTGESTSTMAIVAPRSIIPAGSDQPMTELTSAFDHQAMVIQLLQDWKLKEVSKDRRIAELESEVDQYHEKENEYKDQLDQAKNRTDKVSLTLEATKVRCVANEASLQWLEHQQSRAIVRLGQRGQRLVSETQTAKTHLRELCFSLIYIESLRAKLMELTYTKMMLLHELKQSRLRASVTPHGCITESHVSQQKHDTSLSETASTSVSKRIPKEDEATVQPTTSLAPRMTTPATSSRPESKHRTPGPAAAPILPRVEASTSRGRAKRVGRLCTRTKKGPAVAINEPDLTTDQPTMTRTPRPVKRSRTNKKSKMCLQEVNRQGYFDSKLVQFERRNPASTMMTNYSPYCLAQDQLNPTIYIAASVVVLLATCDPGYGTPETSLLQVTRSTCQ
ncbi:hypothetical protein IWQ61_006620 [Dispira simplex]|nr:hypothetical protein IWQ61_006620 [Dispira simplex]